MKLKISFSCNSLEKANKIRNLVPVSIIEPNQHLFSVDVPNVGTTFLGCENLTLYGVIGAASYINIPNELYTSVWHNI